MARGKNNSARIQVTSAGQIIVTIPRAIATALALTKGMRMEWVIKKDGLLLQLPSELK